MAKTPLYARGDRRQPFICSQHARFGTIEGDKEVSTNG